MFKNILVVARGSDPDQAAIARALLCASPGARVTILDLVHEPVLDGYLGNTVIYEPLRARVVAERREAVEALARGVTGRGFEASGQAVWEYPLDEAVAKHARAESSDLVVLAPEMAKHGLTPTEWRLVTTCAAPVLVAGRRRRRRTARSLRPSTLSTCTPSRRSSIGRSSATHVGSPRERAPSSPSSTATRLPEHLGADLAGAARAERGHRQEALEKLVAEAGLPRSVARLAGGGAPHTLLRQMAERGEADLIVMGALARGRFEEWFIGSTAERVLNGSAADVLAVKASPEL